MSLRKLQVAGSTIELEIDDDGAQAWERRERARAAEQQAFAVATARRRLPPIAARAKFSDPWYVAETRFGAPIVDAGKNWCRARGSALWSAPTGVGKTITSLALINRILDSSLRPEASNEDRAFARGVVYTTAALLVRARKAHGLGRGEADEIREAQSASLAVLDEFGSEGPDLDGSLFEVIDCRYSKRVPTIVLTGLSEPKFRARYGDALIRRLLDVGEHVSMFKGSEE